MFVEVVYFHVVLVLQQTNLHSIECDHLPKVLFPRFGSVVSVVPQGPGVLQRVLDAQLLFHRSRELIDLCVAPIFGLAVCGLSDGNGNFLRWR